MKGREDLPRNLPAERALVGSIITSTKLEGRAELVKPEHFSDEVLREIWIVILRLSERDDPLDIVSVSAALKGSTILPELEAPALITKLIGETPFAGHSDKYAELVLTTDAKRQVALKLPDLARIAYGDGSFDAAAVIARSVQLIEEAGVGIESTDREVWTAAELAALEIPEDPFLLEGLIIDGGVNLLAGDYRAGKTFAALDLALSVSTGSGFAWSRRVGSGSVLYLGADNSRSGLIRRIRDLSAGRGIDPPHESLVFDLSTLDLSDTPGRAILESSIRETRPRLLIIDALVRYLGSIDENSSGDIGSLMAYFRSLANRYGLTVLLIHHLRKIGQDRDSKTLRQAERIRGSGDLIGAPDSILLLTYENLGGEPIRVLSHVKCREAPEAPPVSMSIESGERGGLVVAFDAADPEAGIDSLVDIAAGMMIDALKESEGEIFSTSDLNDAVETKITVQKATLERARSLIREVPLVFSKRGSGRGRPMLYRFGAEIVDI